MPIKRLPVIECSEECILAENIQNGYGSILASEGIKVTNSLKDKFISFGILTVRVYDLRRNRAENTQTTYHNVKTDYTNTIGTYKELICDISTGKKTELDKIAKISKQVQSSINESRNLIRCLNDIQRADEYTYTHSINVSIYCMLIAKWMGFNERDINIAIQSGLLHDIGKVKIPDTILNKRDKLTKEEYELIKKHTIYGFELLNNVEDIDAEVKRAVLTHHERVDGSGYPYNMSEKYISIFSKITAVADVYDAITSERPYSKRQTPFKAFYILYTAGIGMFDTEILSTFLRNIVYYFIGSRVLLNNQEVGTIIHIPIQTPYHPIIEVNGEFINLSDHKKLEVLEILSVE